MRLILATALVVAGIFYFAPPLSAHHGLAEFDTTHTVKMEGIVTEFQWINPHSFIFADIKDEEGEGCELEAGVRQPGNAEQVRRLDTNHGEARRSCDGAGLQGQEWLDVFLCGQDLASGWTVAGG